MPSFDRIAEFYKYSAASASATITRADNTTAYDAGDVINAASGAISSFTSIGKPGGQLQIKAARLRCDINAVPAGMTTFRLHLYNAAPTAINDGVAFNLPSADRAKYLGYITISAPADLGDTIWSETNDLNHNVKLAYGSSTLYAMLETVGGYSPAASSVFTVTLYAIGL